MIFFFKPAGEFGGWAEIGGKGAVDSDKIRTALPCFKHSLFHRQPEVLKIFEEKRPTQIRTKIGKLFRQRPDSFLRRIQTIKNFHLKTEFLKNPGDV